MLRRFFLVANSSDAPRTIRVHCTFVDANAYSAMRVAAMIETLLWAQYMPAFVRLMLLLLLFLLCLEPDGYQPWSHTVTC